MEEIRVVNVMIDLNVLLDVLQAREPWYLDAQAIWRAHNQVRIRGYIAAQALTNLFSIMRRTVGPERARDAVRDCLQTFEVVPVGRPELEQADQLAGTELEDDVVLAPSYAEYAAARPLNAAIMKWSWGQYLAQPGDGRNPYASPLLDRKVGKLPSATVIAAEIDPLQSEGKAYADKLTAAGAQVTYALHPGVTHEFFGMGAVVDEANKAVAEAAAGLKSAFGQ